MPLQNFKSLPLETQEALLRDVFENAKFELALQPIVSLTQRDKIAYYEALLRIISPQAIDPQDAVDYAEKHHLITQLDGLVLNLALQKLKTHNTLSLSINLSPLSLLETRWLALLETALGKEPTLAPRLLLELTERQPIFNIPATKAAIKLLQSKGIKVAMDDYGAGFTSFQLLCELELDCVKIDGSYILAMQSDFISRLFVQQTINMAHALKLKTIAEYVQSEEVASQLLGYGCDYIQGDLTGKAEVF